MKARRKNVLLSLLFFLAAACSPNPPTLTNFYNSGHSYKSGARKQPPGEHPENATKATEKNATLTFSDPAAAKTTLVSGPAKIAHYRPIAANHNKVPEMLASASNEISWLPVNSGGYTYFNSIPPKIPEVKIPLKAASSDKPEAIESSGKSKETQVATFQQKSAQQHDNSLGFLFGLSGILSVILLSTNLKRIRNFS